MLVVFDVGNTNITIGTFENDVLNSVYRLNADKDLPIEVYVNIMKNLFKDTSITGCVIASVQTGLKNILKNACNKVFDCNIVLLDNNHIFNLNICVENPQKVGIDRLLNAYEAKNNYKLPLIVVDIGTAITFDIVDKNGDFIGGIIMPGLNMQLHSLNKNTAQLPLIKLENTDKTIGNSTQKAILSGVVKGTANSIKGLINDCEKELGEKATVIATGGQCELITEQIPKTFDYINKNLTLEGIKRVYKDILQV